MREVLRIWLRDGILTRMSSPDEIRALREAVAAVKGFLEDAGVGIPPNDLIITGVQYHGDLWLFTWNNAWPLLQPRSGRSVAPPIIPARPMPWPASERRLRDHGAGVRNVGGGVASGSSSTSRERSTWSRK